MRLFTAALAAMLTASIAAPATAQSNPPPFRAANPIGEANPQPVQLRCWDATANSWGRCPLSGGGGSSDASAANQAMQITAEQATRDRLGDIASPATGSVNWRLLQLLTTAQGPIPAGTAVIGSVGGTQTIGSAVSGGGFRLTLADAGGLAQDVKGDSTALYVQGPGATGTTAVGRPIRVGATDANGNLQSIKTDGSGNLIAVGPSAAGSAASGAPLRFGFTAASDGTIQALKGDFATGAAYVTPPTANGFVIQGAAASGAAVAGNPVQLGFSDGSTAQRVKGNPSTGALYVEEQARTAYFSETSTALAASATFTGASRDVGGTTTGSPTRWGSFGCLFRADQAGTATLQGSNDNASWFTIQSQPLAALTTLALTTPLYTHYHRCVLVNGSTAQGSVTINSRVGL